MATATPLDSVEVTEEEDAAVARTVRLTRVLILVITILRTMMMQVLAFLSLTLPPSLTMLMAEMICRQWEVMAEVLVEVSIRQTLLLSGLITVMEDIMVMI